MFVIFLDIDGVLNSEMFARNRERGDRSKIDPFAVGNRIERLTLPRYIKFLNCDRDVDITNLEEIREKNPNVHIIMG